MKRLKLILSLALGLSLSVGCFLNRPERPVREDGAMDEEVLAYIKECLDLRMDAQKGRPVLEHDVNLHVPIDFSLKSIPKTKKVRLKLFVSGKKLQQVDVDVLLEQHNTASLVFDDCSLSSSTLVALARSKNFFELTFKNCELVGDAVSATETKKIVSDLSIEQCAPEFARQVLDLWGLSKRTMIQMPQTFSLDLNRINADCKQLIISGCDLVIGEKFRKNNNLLQIIVTQTRLSAKDVSYILSSPDLSELTLYPVQIAEDELDKIEVPKTFRIETIFQVDSKIHKVIAAKILTKGD